MRNITIGYFDLTEKNFISDIVITNNFLSHLGHYIKVKIIPVNKQKDIKESFKKIEKYNLDYVYINEHSFLLESFLLREKFRLDIPFIFAINMVYGFVDPHIFVIPLIREYDIICAPSQYAKESFFRISDRFNLCLIPHSLDMNFIQNNISRNFKKDRKTITFMGRLTEKKGIGTLIKCMPGIIAKVRNAHLNIIGPLRGTTMEDYPKSKYVKKLERDVRRLKLTDRVHFKGVQFGLDKYRILSESDIFINPTLEEEIFGVVNIEALACGVPVIVTKGRASKELIMDGKNGFLVDINYGKDKKPKIDVKQLVSLIVKVLKDERLNLKMKRDSLKSALNYDYRKVLPRFISLLKRRRRGEAKDRWNIIKNKRAMDFRYLFNKNVLFFICFGTGKKTYSSLYKEFIDQKFLEHRDYSNYSNSLENIDKEKPKEIKIFDKIRQDFSDFLSKK